MVFKRRIAVFCGSALGLHEDYAVASERLGELIGRQGRTLVFGGCLDGLMAKVALAAHKEGAQICCEFVRGLYQAKDHLPGTVEKVYDHVRERKHGLLADSDACIALPGGMGTLDEFSEVFAAVQLGEIQHPVGFLNVCAVQQHEPAEVAGSFGGVDRTVETFLDQKWKISGVIHMRMGQEHKIQQIGRASCRERV